VSNEDVVQDVATLLMWERTTGAKAELTWEQANAYCTGLGDDFRLPSLKELLTLVDPTRADPSLDRLFADVPHNSFFWTSTPVHANPKKHWFVVMSGGWTIHEEGLDSLRAMQPPPPFTLRTRCVRSAESFVL
jgi:hypothetical protein